MRKNNFAQKRCGKKNSEQIKDNNRSPPNGNETNLNYHKNIKEIPKSNEKFKTKMKMKLKLPQNILTKATI